MRRAAVSEEEVLEQVKRGVHALLRAQAASDDAVVAHLVSAGTSPLSAERLCVFLPLAFGRAELTRLGMRAFPWTLRVETADDAVLQLDISADAYFKAALQLAVETLEGGGIDGPDYDALARLSPEVNATLRAKSSGVDLSVAALIEPVWRSKESAQSWCACGATPAPQPGMGAEEG